MSLKDLLPEGTFEEICGEARRHAEYTGRPVHQAGHTDAAGVLWVRCPQCGRAVPYSLQNPYRPFCSEACRIIDLGAWAAEEHKVAGEPVNQDEDADLLQDPSLPRR